MNHKTQGNTEEEMRLWHLLHEALTETTLVQPIMSSYPQPNSMLYPWDTNCNTLQKIGIEEDRKKEVKEIKESGNGLWQKKGKYKEKKKIDWRKGVEKFKKEREEEDI